MSQSTPSRPEGESPSQIDAEVQRELDEALQGRSIEELMEQAPAPESAPDQPPAGTATPEQGQGAPREFHHEVRRGRIAAIRGEDVFVEIAGEASKMQGIVPLIQFDRPPRIGSIMDFVIDHADEAQGLIFLSREGAVSRSTWEQLQRGAIVEARVVATNKGGLELEMIGGIRAFMPASQIDLHHVKDLEPLIGEKFEGAVQEIDRKSKKVVLSRRQVLQQRREQAREKLLAEIEPGKILDGTVSNIVDFGAFVDIGGVDGLVHVSDLSYTHVDKPSEVLKVGQAVRVKVLKIDREHDRISLGIKQVEPDPWEGIEGRVRPGQSVEGKVIRTANFGAFVEILPGVEGLLPLSEMSWRRVHRAEEVVKAGDTIRLAVLQVDPAKRRISLSLKQSQGDPWVGAERKFAAGSVVEGTVLSTTDFGAFIELESGVEGLVHISELADRRVGRVEDVVKVGDPVKVRVLEVSEDARKIRLSIKQVDKPAPPQATAEEIARHSAPAQTAARRPAKDLKGGMDQRGGLGKGLGGLSLDDFK